LRRQALVLTQTGAVEDAMAADQRAAHHQARFAAAAASERV
jgi:hypothetical protein